MPCHLQSRTTLYFFSCKSGPLSQLGDRLTAYRALQSCSCASTRAHARSGKRLEPAGAASSSTRSSGGASRWCGCSGAGQARPSAVVATACCTATLSMPHQRRVQPARTARRKAGGARCAPDSEQVAQEALGFGVPAASDLRAQHDELLRPALAEFWVSRLFATLGDPERRAIGFSVPVCGRPARVHTTYARNAPSLHFGTMRSRRAR